MTEAFNTADAAAIVGAGVKSRHYGVRSLCGFDMDAMPAYICRIKETVY